MKKQPRKRVRGGSPESHRGVHVHVNVHVGTPDQKSETGSIWSYLLKLLKQLFK